MAEAEVAVQYGEEEDATPEPTALPPDTSLKLEDALWGLASYAGGVVLEDSFITADFDAGEVAGSAGCNDYFGPYETSGSEITIGALGSTRKACQDPPGVMEQETAYLTTLPEASTYSIGESGLQMFDSSGAEILQYLAYVMGTVTYDQKIALPPDAVLNIQLQDVSLVGIQCVLCEPLLNSQVIYESLDRVDHFSGYMISDFACKDSCLKFSILKIQRVHMVSISTDEL